jgi:hypothetical protein
MQLKLRNRRGGVGIALACLVLGAPQAWACGWWPFDEARYGCRQPARGYGYTRGYGYRGWPRAYGDNYATVPSTAIPPSRAYLATAPPLPDAGSGGLTPPIATTQGILASGIPSPGPSLFGPSPPAYGYYYSGYYYRARGSYYRAPGYYYVAPGYYDYGYSRPPPPTAWLERRRIR